MAFIDFGDIGGIGAIGSAISDVIGLFQSKDSGPKRADWARLDLLTKQAAAATQLSQAAMFAPSPLRSFLPGGPAPSAQVMASIRAPVQPQSAFISIDRRAEQDRFIPTQFRDEAMMSNGSMQDESTLKDLISMISQGASEHAIQSVAKDRKFTLKKYRALVLDFNAMGRIWSAMGGRWLDPALNDTRAMFLRFLNVAMQGTKVRRRRRMMSLRTMERAASQAKRWEKALKKMGTIKRPCPPTSKRR